MLGRVQRAVGPAQHLVLRRQRTGRAAHKRDADARRHVQAARRRRERPRHRRDDFRADPLGFVRTLDVLQQHDEFVAGQPRRHVGGAHAGRQALREFLQHLVADAVAPGVVDDLEVVDVEVGQSQYLALAARPFERLAQHLAEQAAVGDPGQAVEAGHLHEAALRFLYTRHVVRQRVHAADAHGQPPLRLHVGHERPFEDAVPVLRLQRHLERGAIAFERRLQARPGGVVRGLAERLRQVHAGQARPFDAEPRLERGVAKAQAVVAVDVADQHRQVVGDQAQALLARGLRQFRFLALADVHRHHGEAGHAAVRSDVGNRVDHLVAARVVAAYVLDVAVLAVQRGADQRFQPRIAGFAQHFPHGAAECVVRRRADHPVEAGIGEFEALVAVDIGDHGRDVVGDRAHAGGGALARAHQVVEGAAQFPDLVAAVERQQAAVGAGVTHGRHVAPQRIQRTQRAPHEPPRQHACRQREPRRHAEHTAAHAREHRECLRLRIARAENPAGARQPLVADDGGAVAVAAAQPALEAVQRAVEAGRGAGRVVEAVHQARLDRMVDQYTVRRHQEQIARLAGTQRVDLAQEARVLQVDAAGQHVGDFAVVVEHGRRHEHDPGAGQTALERIGYETASAQQGFLEIRPPGRRQRLHGRARRAGRDQVAVAREHGDVDEFVAQVRHALGQPRLQAARIAPGVRRDRGGERGHLAQARIQQVVEEGGGGTQCGVLLSAQHGAQVLLGHVHGQRPRQQGGAQDQHADGAGQAAAQGGRKGDRSSHGMGAVRRYASGRTSMSYPPGFHQCKAKLQILGLDAAVWFRIAGLRSSRQKIPQGHE